MGIEFEDGDEVVFDSAGTDPADVTLGAEYRDDSGLTVGVDLPTPYTRLYGEDGLMDGVRIGVGDVGDVVDVGVNVTLDDDSPAWETIANVDNQIEGAIDATVDTVSGALDTVSDVINDTVEAASDAATAAQESVSHLWSGDSTADEVDSPGFDDGRDADADGSTIDSSPGIAYESDPAPSAQPAWGEHDESSESGWGNAGSDSDSGSDSDQVSGEADSGPDMGDTDSGSDSSWSGTDSGSDPGSSDSGFDESGF